MIDAHEYLASIRAVEIRIQMKINQMHQLQDRVDSISAPPLDKDRVMRTKDPSVMEKTMDLIIDLQREIDQQTCQLMGRKIKALCLLDQMQAENARILSCYYLEGKSTKELGKTLFLSRQQIQRRLKEAMIEFQLILSRQAPEDE